MTTRSKQWRGHGTDASSIDRVFDDLVLPELRHLSQVHWTPIDIAIRAAALMCPRPETRVLDIGAGIGKLCLVGALSELGTWYGVEQHWSLVHAAEQLAHRFGVADRTTFLHGDAFTVDWCEFDALYLYNPFELDRPLASPADTRRVESQAARARARLAMLRDGTRVVTLHGFGDVMPPGYTLVYHERVPVHDLDLVLWVRGSEAGSGVRP
jgi:hypothetical protein